MYLDGLLHAYTRTWNESYRELQVKGVSSTPKQPTFVRGCLIFKLLKQKFLNFN